MTIDVVIPARNAEKTLPACLAGLWRADFDPADIILCDDGSQDRTAEIARTAGVRIVSTNGRGAATARNAGVAASDAPIILFVDADVALHAGTRSHVAAFFVDHPGHAALIGSYDDRPPAPGTLSRIRNLLHHHVHQTSGGDVASFWTGCGAIRRADFHAMGRFESGHPLEDVALGLALARSGRPVRLDPGLLCTHLKSWSFASMVRADLLYRALPWSRMLLDPANADLPATLNASGRGKLSVVLSALGLAAALVVPVLPMALWVMLAMLAALAGLHANFLGLVARNLGSVAVMVAVAVLWVHFLCAGSGFAWALLERATGRAT